MSFHAPAKRYKKEDQKKTIEAAIIAETSALRAVGLNFLPADQLRGKALVNLAIPSCFGGKVNWASIGPDFTVSVRARPTTPRPRGVTPYEGPRKFFKTRLPRPPEDQYENVPLRTPCASAGGRRGRAPKPTPAAGASTTSNKTPSKTRRRTPKRVLLRVESDDEGPGVTPSETPEPAVQPVQPRARADRAVGHTDINADTFEPASSPEDLHQQRSRPVTLGILGTKQRHRTSKSTRGAAAARAEEMTRKLVERGDESRRDTSDAPPVEHALGPEQKQKPGRRRDPVTAPPAHQKQRPQPQSAPSAPPAPPVEKVSVLVSDKLQSRQDASMVNQPQHSDLDLLIGSDETRGVSPGAPTAGWVDSTVDFTMTFREAVPRPSPATVTQSGANRPVKRRSLSLKKKEKPSTSVEDTASSPTPAKQRALQPTAPSPILSQKRVVRLSSPALSSHPDCFSDTTFVHSPSPRPAVALKAPQVKPGASQQTGSTLYRPLPLKVFGRIVGPASSLAQAEGPIDSDSSEANLPSHSQYKIIPPSPCHGVASPVLSKRGESQCSTAFSAPFIIRSFASGAPGASPPFDRPPSAHSSDKSDSSDVIQPSQYQYVRPKRAALEEQRAPSAHSDESNSSDPIKPSQRVRPSRVASQKQRSSSPPGRSPTVSSGGRKRREGSSSGGSRPSQLTPGSGEQRERASRALFPCEEEDAELAAPSEEDTEADVTIERGLSSRLSSRTSTGMNMSKSSAGTEFSRMSRDRLSGEPVLLVQRVSQTHKSPYSDSSNSSDVIQPTQYVKPSRAATEKRVPSAQFSDKSDSSDAIQPSQYVRPNRAALEEQRPPSARSSDKSDSSDVIPPTQYVEPRRAAPEEERAPSAQYSDESNSSDPIKPSQRVRPSRVASQKQRSSSPPGRSPTVSSGGRKRREGSSSGGSRPSQPTPGSGEQRERASRALFPCEEEDAELAAPSEEDTEADVTLECGMSSRTSIGMNVSRTSTGMNISRSFTRSSSRISKNSRVAEPEHREQHVSLRDAAERALRATQGRQDRCVKPTSVSRSRSRSKTPSSRRGSYNSTPRQRAAADAPSDSDSEETLRVRKQERRARRARELRRQGTASSERKLAVERGEPGVRREVQRQDVAGKKASVSECEVSIRRPPTPRHDVVDVPPVMVAESSSDPEPEKYRRSVTIDSIVGRFEKEPPCSIPTPFQAYDSTTDEETRKGKRLLKSPPLYRPALSTTTESSTKTSTSTHNQPSSDVDAASSEPNEGALPLTQPLPKPRGPKMSIGETIVYGAGRRPKSPGPGPGPSPHPGPRPGPADNPGPGPRTGPSPRPGLHPGPGSGPGRGSGPSTGHGPDPRRAVGLGRKRKGSTPSTEESNRSRTAVGEKCSVSVDRVRTRQLPLEENMEPGSESDPSLDLGSDIDMDDIEDTDEGSESPTPTPARPVPTTPGRAPPRSRHRPDRDDTVNRNLFHDFETPRRPLDQLMNPKRIRMSEGKSTAPTPDHSSRSSISTSTCTSAAQLRAQQPQQPQQDQHHNPSQESSLSSLAPSRTNPMDKSLSSAVSVTSSRTSISVEVVWNKGKRAPAGGLCAPPPCVPAEAAAQNPRAGKDKENTDPSIQAKREDEDEYGDDRQKSDSPPNSLELISFYSPE